MVIFIMNQSKSVQEVSLLNKRFGNLTLFLEGKRISIWKKAKGIQEKGGIIKEDLIVPKYHRRFLMLFQICRFQLFAAPNDITGASQH